MLTNQHFLSAFNPHQSANQRISKSEFFPRSTKGILVLPRSQPYKTIWNRGQSHQLAWIMHKEAKTIRPPIRRGDTT